MGDRISVAVRIFVQLSYQSPHRTNFVIPISVNSKSETQISALFRGEGGALRAHADKGGGASDFCADEASPPLSGCARRAAVPR